PGRRRDTHTRLALPFGTPDCSRPEPRPASPGRHTVNVQSGRLWRGAKAEDIRVTEVRGAVLLRGWPRHSRPITQRLTPRVHLQAVSVVARIVPHGSAVGPCGCGVHVVAEGLGHQIVLAGAAWIAVGPTVGRPGRPGRL